MTRHITPSLLERFRSDNGVSLIHVALLLFVLMGFSTFVMDYGVLWLARGQAQNAADAGALAGAIARLYDETGNPPAPGGAAEESALIGVDGHKVIGEVPAREVWFENKPLTGPPTCVPGAGNPNPRCVQVDVFRNTGAGNALPTFFATAFNIKSQDIRATATAQLIPANWSECLRPWMVMDKWGPDLNGNNKFDPGTGEYTAPGYKATGTPNDIGTVITLAAGDPSDALTSSEYFRIDLTGGGSNAYDDNIEGCAGVTPTSKFWTLPGKGSGPETYDAVTALMTAMAPQPVVVPLALFSPEEWYTLDRQSGKYQLTIVNFLGFEVISVTKKGEVTGKLLQTAGEMRTDAPALPGPAGNSGGGFLLVPVLVRCYPRSEKWCDARNPFVFGSATRGNRTQYRFLSDAGAQF